MNQHIVIFLLLLVIGSVQSYQDIFQRPYNVSDCTNYYSVANPPVACLNTTSCYFQSGLQSLITSPTSNTTFLLCIDLPGYDLYVTFTNATTNYYQEISSVYIYANKVVMENNYSILCENYFFLYTESQIVVSSTQLTGTKIVLISQGNLTINNSIFINQSVIQSACSCAKQQTTCPWNFSYPQLFDLNDSFNITDISSVTLKQLYNNTVTIVSQASLFIYSTTIRYSIIGIFAEQVSIINSTITTTGLGYASDSGPGCGYFNQILNQLLGCMGSGGSHGGYGGSSSPQNCYLLVSRQPYGQIVFPNQPGSGGGFFLPHSKQSSSGGGVINIQALSINFFKSSVLSQGKNGVQGGGGGAGGSISLDYNFITSINSNIKANGGNGDRISSSGSGGRVRLWNHNWKNQNQSGQGLNINVTGGSGCRPSEIFGSLQLSCGQNGSVFTSPCKPGTALNELSYICNACPPGTYQLTYGYSPCLPCLANPENSYWVSNSIINGSGYEISCTYLCNDNYQLYNGQCLTKGQLIEKMIYAVNIYISLGIIAVAVIIYLIIYCHRKFSERSNFLDVDDPSFAQNFRRKFFRLQDIPYHEMRIYLEGENHPSRPWKISQETLRMFDQEARSPVMKISPIIEKVIKQINKKAAFNKWEKLIVSGLRYTYYPLSRIVLSSLRKVKAQQIFEEVDKFNKKIISQEDSLMIKFHVKPQQTIASIQIFNYKKSVLDFYIQNYFPLYIKLEKVPFGGYMVDFKDPFLKVFVNQILQKQGSSKPIEVFLNEVNKFLRNPAKILSCLNQLWALQQITPKIQSFLWQPTKKIMGMDKNYKINNKEALFLVFNSESQNCRHFITNEELPPLYLQQIESLRHKFMIKKDLAGQQDGNSFCIINNKISLIALLWVFGVLTTFFILLAIAILALTVFTLRSSDTCNIDGSDFMYGFIIYFALWPLCDLFGGFFNCKTIIQKNEYVLADSIAFNVLSLVKCLILFIASLVNNQNQSSPNVCLQANEFIWLSMTLICIVLYVIQIMLRARMISQSKIAE